MGIKLSSNPMKAYLQGKADGEKAASAADIRRGMNLVYAYLLLAMAYTNERSNEGKKDYLSKPQFKEFYEKFAKTLQDFVSDSIKGEQGIDTYDIADLYIAHDETIRKRYGLGLKKYDGKDEVL